jgi:CHASE2 domain-containing sensor protein
MPCGDYNSTTDALGNFSGQAPIDAITCTYSADWGLGMGGTFLMFVVGFMGLGLAIRTRHPGPVLIAGMLSAGVFAVSLPGIVAKIFALVIFIGFSAAGLYIYQRMQGAL